MIRRPSSLEAAMCIALDIPAFSHLPMGDQVNGITSQTSLLLLLIAVFRAAAASSYFPPPAPALHRGPQQPLNSSLAVAINPGRTYNKCNEK
jgi:hypothetical protein